MFQNISGLTCKDKFNAKRFAHSYYLEQHFMKNLQFVFQPNILNTVFRFSQKVFGYGAAKPIVGLEMIYTSWIKE